MFIRQEAVSRPLHCLIHAYLIVLVCPPQILEERGAKENMRFDPKLKGKGLLDLFMTKPDTSVPK